MTQISLWVTLLWLSTYLCTAAGVTIVVSTVPATADTLEVVADGTNLAVPVIGVVSTQKMSLVTLQLDVSPSFDIRIRAIALRENGSLFPMMMAAVGGQFSASDPKVLSFGSNSISLGATTDNGDGTIAVPVTFSGFDNFLSVGQLAELWVSTSPPSRNGSGQLYFASLAALGKKITGFQATFVIPSHVFNDAPSFFQVGYYALDSAIAQAIPLLVYPNTDKDLALLFAPTLTGVSTKNADRPSIGLSTPNLASDVAPTHNDEPGVYGVRVGKDGRLTQVLIRPSGR